MWDWFSQLWSAEGFRTPDECGGWSRGLVRLVEMSDTTLFLTFTAIPIGFWVYSRQHHLRGSLRNLLYTLGILIFFCGLTHLARSVMWAYPAYRIVALADVVTAFLAVSFIAIALPMVVRGHEQQARLERDTQWGMVEGLRARLTAREREMVELFRAMDRLTPLLTPEMRDLIDRMDRRSEADLDVGTRKPG